MKHIKRNFQCTCRPYTSSDYRVIFSQDALPFWYQETMVKGICSAHYQWLSLVLI